MILSTGGLPDTGFVVPWPLVALAMLAYAVAALAPTRRPRVAGMALGLAGATHLLLLVLDIGGFGSSETGARLGFGPVLSLTVYLVLLVHGLESRLLPLPPVRRTLATVGALAVLLAAVFPGEVRPVSSPWAPLHFVLGIASYGLFGAAVLHALMLDAAERRLRQRRGGSLMPGVPLLQLERLTFRIVQLGFVVLSAALLLGVATTERWRWEHKTVFSLLGWLVFALLLLGRWRRGWRGRQATVWLYGGALLLLLAYVGSRFVFEVMLGRPAP